MSDTAIEFWDKILPFHSETQKSYLEDVLSYTLLHSEDPATVKIIIEDLKTTFSSWNEVRIATINELVEFLQERNSSRPEFTAKLIQKILTLIWQHLDNFELEKADVKEIKILLEKIPSNQIKSYISCLALNQTSPPWESNTERVISRYFGTSETKLSKEKYAESIIDKDKRLCHRAIINFAKSICIEIPKCQECRLNPNCKSKKC